MEKKGRMDWPETIGALWKALIVAAVLFILGILASSALIWKDIVPISWCILLLYASVTAESFGTAVFLALLVQHQLFLKALLTQAVFFILLLLLGLLDPAAVIDVVQLGVSALLSVAASFAALLLFGGRKKKKIQKNSTIRLKKKSSCGKI